MNFWLPTRRGSRCAATFCSGFQARPYVTSPELQQVKEGGLTFVAESTSASSFSSSATTSTCPSLEARWRAFRPFWERNTLGGVCAALVKGFTMRQCYCELRGRSNISFRGWECPFPFKPLSLQLQIWPMQRCGDAWVWKIIKWVQNIFSSFVFALFVQNMFICVLN